jgi:hypothetical protein
MVKENIYKRLSADVDRVYGKKVVRNMRRFVISDPEGWYTSMATTFFDLGI